MFGWVFLQVSPGGDQDRSPRKAGHVSAPQGLCRGARRARAGVITDKVTNNKCNVRDSKSDVFMQKREEN